MKSYKIKQIFEKIRIGTLGFESSRFPAKLALRFESGFDESLIRATTIALYLSLYLRLPESNWAREPDTASRKGAAANVAGDSSRLTRDDSFLLTVSLSLSLSPSVRNRTADPGQASLRMPAMNSVAN
jgi:hypothetical protein